MFEYENDNYMVIDENGKIYFVGTYWDCDEWREHNCKDVSTWDEEILLYKGKQVYIEKRG